MSRISRKNRKDILIAVRGGLSDIMDNVMKEVWRINDYEYDYICDNATDEELSIITNDKPTFTEARQAITIVDKYVADSRDVAKISKMNWKKIKLDYPKAWVMLLKHEPFITSLPYKYYVGVLDIFFSKNKINVHVEAFYEYQRNCMESVAKENYIVGYEGDLNDRNGRNIYAMGWVASKKECLEQLYTAAFEILEGWQK